MYTARYPITRLNQKIRAISNSSVSGNTSRARIASSHFEVEYKQNNKKAQNSLVPPRLIVEQETILLVDSTKFFFWVINADKTAEGAVFFSHHCFFSDFRFLHFYFVIWLFFFQ